MSKKFFIPVILSFIVCVSCNPSSKEKTSDQATVKVEETTTDSSSAQRTLQPHDVSGTYGGTLPCEDCDSTEVTLVLKDDGTYEMTEEHFGKKKDTLKNEGDWSFNENESTVTLSGYKVGVSKGPKTFLVANEALTPVDKNGKALAADSGEDNVLTKQ